MKRLQDPNSGKFVPKPKNKKGVKTTIFIPAEDIEKLRSLLQDGETLSDKIREAIAQYLQK